MARGTAGVLVLAALLLAACRRAPSDDDAAIRKRLGQKSTAVLMQEVAKAEFKPPADGRLTELEIRSYMKMEERSRRIRAVAAQGAAPELGATADLRAAQELGLNPKEMAWVRIRVREARVARVTESVDRRIAGSRLAYIRRLQIEGEQTTDPAYKKDIERRIAEFSRASVRSGPADPPWVRWNAELLARYVEVRQGGMIFSSVAVRKRRRKRQDATRRVPGVEGACASESFCYHHLGTNEGADPFNLDVSGPRPAEGKLED